MDKLLSFVSKPAVFSGPFKVAQPPIHNSQPRTSLLSPAPHGDEVQFSGKGRARTLAASALLIPGLLLTGCGGGGDIPLPPDASSSSSESASPDDSEKATREETAPPEGSETPKAGEESGSTDGNSGTSGTEGSSGSPSPSGTSSESTDTKVPATRVALGSRLPYAFARQIAESTGRNVNEVYGELKGLSEHNREVIALSSSGKMEPNTQEMDVPTEWLHPSSTPSPTSSSGSQPSSEPSTAPTTEPSAQPSQSSSALWSKSVYSDIKIPQNLTSPFGPNPARLKADFDGSDYALTDNKEANKAFYGLYAYLNDTSDRGRQNFMKDNGIKEINPYKDPVYRDYFLMLWNIYAGKAAEVNPNMSQREWFDLIAYSIDRESKHVLTAQNNNSQDYGFIQLNFNVWGEQLGIQSPEQFSTLIRDDFDAYAKAAFQQLSPHLAKVQDAGDIRLAVWRPAYVGAKPDTIIDGQFPGQPGYIARWDRVADKSQFALPEGFQLKVPVVEGGTFAANRLESTPVVVSKETLPMPFIRKLAADKGLSGASADKYAEMVLNQLNRAELQKLGAGVTVADYKLYHNAEFQIISSDWEKAIQSALS